MKYKVLKPLALKTVDNLKTRVFKAGEILEPNKENLIIISEALGSKTTYKTEYVFSGVLDDEVKELKDPIVDKPKNKGGRPTKWNEKFCDELMEFFEIDRFEDVKLNHYDKDGETIKWVDIKRMANELPTFARFAKKIGVHYDTLLEWAKEENVKKYPGFSVAYAHAKEIQKDFLIQNGLQGLYNPAFAIFTAKNITDMKDKQETDLNLSGTVNLVGLFDASKKKKDENKKG